MFSNALAVLLHQHKSVIPFPKLALYYYARITESKSVEPKPHMPFKPKHKKSSNKASRPQKVKTSRGLVRIIAGTHRARRLPVLVHEGLRPTGDRVKETLFNWLMSDVEGSVCLDMYAGSSSLALKLCLAVQNMSFS